MLWVGPYLWISLSTTDSALPCSASGLDEMVWTAANRYLREKYPGIHLGLKRAASPWLRRDINVRIPKRVAGRLFWTRPWLLSADQPESHVVQWILKELKRGGTLFDVGAHYGWMSMLAAKHVGAEGHIISFEPSPVLLDVLSYHKRVNGLQQMQIVPSAVSDADGGAVPFFVINNGLSSRNSLTIGPDNTPFISPEEKIQIDVPCTTLDSFVRRSGVIPDLVKIDVEGAELFVLEGAKELLAVHRPVLIVGVHPYWMPLAHSVDQVFALIEELGYELQDQHIFRFTNSYLADYLFVPLS